MSVAADATALTYTYPAPQYNSCSSLTVNTSGQVACTPATGAAAKFFFSNAQFPCQTGISISPAGDVQCAATPNCALTPGNSTLVPGASVTLKASCTQKADAYVWSGGACASNTGDSCVVVSQTGSTIYTVSGKNNLGSGNTASATVKEALVTGQKGPFAYIAQQVGTPTSSAPGGVISVVDTSANALVAGVSVNVDAYPVGVAVNPTGSRVYVANNGSNTVSVIDTSSVPRLMSTINVGSGPFGIAVNPAGTRVYVANNGSNTVTVIDTASNSVVGNPISVGKQPMGVAVNPAGTKVYVANNGDDSVSVIDTSSVPNSVKKVVVNTAPVGVAVNPAGTRVYVANNGSGTVSVIDVSSQPTLISNITVGQQPTGVAVNPAGTQAYVVNSGSRTISVIDAASNTVANTLDAANNGLGSALYNIAFDQTDRTDPTADPIAWAYVTNTGNGTVSTLALDPAINRVTANDVPANAKAFLGNFVGPVIKEKTYQDLWWNPSESGWGMSITQHDANRLWATIFTFDSTGNPVWYALDSCQLIPGSTSGTFSCNGQMSQFSNGRPPELLWNGAQTAASEVGAGKLTFADAGHLNFEYTTGGLTYTKNLIRQSIDSTGTPPPVDYSDLWWNKNEPGWGVSMTHRYGKIFAAWFVYDATGKPAWYVASDCPVINGGCKGKLYKVPKGLSLTALNWDASKVSTAAEVGSVTFTFTDANNGIMEYSNSLGLGVFRRLIARQPF